MKNQRYKDALDIDIAVPSGVLSGDFVVVGDIKGFANIDRQADGTVSLRRAGSFLVNARAANGGGNSAIAVGDIIYYHAANVAEPKFNKVNTGVKVGAAITVLASGADGEVEVLLKD